LFFVESKALTVMEARKEEKKLKVLCSGLGGGKLTKAVSSCIRFHLLVGKMVD